MICPHPAGGRPGGRVCERQALQVVVQHGPRPLLAVQGAAEVRAELAGLPGLAASTARRQELAQALHRKYADHILY